MDGKTSSLLPSPIMYSHAWMLKVGLCDLCFLFWFHSAPCELLGWLHGRNRQRSQEMSFMQWIFCIAGMPIIYNPEWERRKGSLGSSIEERGGGGKEERKIDEILHLNGRQTGTRSQIHPPPPPPHRNPKHMWSGEDESAKEEKILKISFSHFPSWNWMANSIQSFLDDWADATEANRTCVRPASAVSRTEWVKSSQIKSTKT